MQPSKTFIIREECEKLINSVHNRPPIWDNSCDNHHNRFVLDELWSEIAQENNARKKDVKSKWKYLRDNFRKEYSKDPNSHTTWPYFKNLMFLKDQFRWVKSSQYQNLQLSSPINVIKEEQDKSEENDFINESSQSSKLEDSECQPPFTGDHSGISSSTSFNSATTGIRTMISFDREPSRETNLELGRPERRILDESYEDTKFFESLLPHVKKIPSYRKLLFRCQIQELVQKYAYEGN
ncbi:hypothetical protein C0J52_10473 [Blattella germanica]|nr:hypothetical protein C0J52_10473 [Blattella germanica]